MARLSLDTIRGPAPSLAGRRVVITGAARGIGAALAVRLHERGARVALVGLEPDLLAQVAGRCGDAPWAVCDVGDRLQVDDAIEQVVAALGGLDVVVANAGIAAQLPIVGGDPAIMEATVRVNLLGAYYTVRAAGPHISHPGGYALVVSSLASAVNLPLLAAYSASKAGVEALGNTPLEVGIDALERGIARRRRRIVAPAWVAAVLPVRALTARFVEVYARRNLSEALRLARTEQVELTTPQPAVTPSTQPVGEP